MISFSELLQKVTIAIPTETNVRNFLVEYLKENCNITIDRKQIHLKKNTVELKIPPTAKAKFNPHCDECLEKLNEHLKEKGLQIVIKKIH